LHEAQVARAKTLEDILDSLRTGYNPNYQDMAVLEAVRGWEQIAGLPHINDIKKDDESEEVAGEKSGAGEGETINPEEVKKDVEQLLKADYVSLLMEHDKHVGNAGRGPTSLRTPFNIFLALSDLIL
jgi:protein kinase C substrate 80K-H